MEPVFKRAFQVSGGPTSQRLNKMELKPKIKLSMRLAKSIAAHLVEYGLCSDVANKLAADYSLALTDYADVFPVVEKIHQAIYSTPKDMADLEEEIKHREYKILIQELQEENEFLRMRIKHLEDDRKDNSPF